MSEWPLGPPPRKPTEAERFQAWRDELTGLRLLVEAMQVNFEQQLEACACRSA